LFIEDLREREIEFERPIAYVDHSESTGEEYPLKAYLKDLLSGIIE